jgi:hypothetical protein
MDGRHLYYWVSWRPVRGTVINCNVAIIGYVLFDRHEVYRLSVEGEEPPLESVVHLRTCVLLNKSTAQSAPDSALSCRSR